jgi:cytoskeletal protein CcmA (bactofilin family)
MASTTFSGPVTSTNGFVGAVVTATTANVGTVNATAVTVSGPVVANTVTAAAGVYMVGAANVIVIPTVDPAVIGAIWNNAGTLSISTG